MIFNPFMTHLTILTIIQKPWHWFALQINGLVLYDRDLRHESAKELQKLFISCNKGIVSFHLVSCDPQEFFDDDTLYRFIFDLEWETPLHKLLHITEDDPQKNMTESFKKMTLVDSNNKKYLSKFWNGKNLLQQSS